MDANESTEVDVYHEIMRDVHKQWLQEFDHEAAIRRNLPRRERESRFRSALARLRGRDAGAQQCA